MKQLVIWALILGGVGYGGAKFYLHHEVADTMDKAVLMLTSSTMACAQPCPAS